jgi:hypothetical protein
MKGEKISTNMFFKDHIVVSGSYSFSGSRALPPTAVRGGSASLPCERLSTIIGGEACSFDRNIDKFLLN